MGIWGYDHQGELRLEAMVTADGDDHAINIRRCLQALREAGWDLDSMDTAPSNTDSCLTLADAVLATMRKVKY